MSIEKPQSHDLELFLLGSPQITVAGEQITTFKTRKIQALLIYLAVTGQAHSRDTLAGLLWSDMPQKNARRSLRQALHGLRQAIDPTWLVVDETIALNPAISWTVDVDRKWSASTVHDIAGLSAI
ncbi:MAG: hypothetical protein AAF639_35920, partial [Chloroflexota bacterium]